MVVPTNITRPYDIAIIFAIFALVVVTIGFGVSSMVDDEGVTGVDQSFFTQTKYNLNQSEGLKGAADSVSQGLTGSEGASTEPSEESLLLAGFNSILKLGKTFKVMSDSMSTGSQWLGVDPIYWLTWTAVLLVCFGVVMYTWIRGR